MLCGRKRGFCLEKKPVVGAGACLCVAGSAAAGSGALQPRALRASERGAPSVTVLARRWRRVPAVPGDIPRAEAEAVAGIHPLLAVRAG